jgi:hypothetical protein
MLLDDRFLIPALQHAINNIIVDEIEVGPVLLEVSVVQKFVKEAFEIILADRVILQFLVDTHCDTWTSCCEETGPLPVFPYAFVVRAMRRFGEILQEERSQTTIMTRCYYKHVDKAALADCGRLHMRYDAEKDFGFFGKRVHCANCGCGKQPCVRAADSASESSVSGSESGADQDNEKGPTDQIAGVWCLGERTVKEPEGKHGCMSPVSARCRPGLSITLVTITRFSSCANVHKPSTSAIFCTFPCCKVDNQLYASCDHRLLMGSCLRP